MLLCVCGAGAIAHERRKARTRAAAAPPTPSGRLPLRAGHGAHAPVRAVAAAQAEVIVKPVADRSKGFSELQTFDPQQARSLTHTHVYTCACVLMVSLFTYMYICIYVYIYISAGISS